jgi:hypothetical protein
LLRFWTDKGISKNDRYAKALFFNSKLKRLLQGAADGVVATIFFGLNWSGWSLSSTADKMAKE